MLDKSEDPLRGIEFVIYAQPGLDITDSVIQNLNRGYRKDAKNPADAEKKENGEKKSTDAEKEKKETQK